MGEELREFLVGRDAACLRCGYNLRGLMGETCPECGWEVSLEKLREVEEHRAWRESRMPRDPITSAGLIGSVLGLGWPVVWLMLAFGVKAVGLSHGQFVTLVMGSATQLGIVAVYLNGDRMNEWSRGRRIVLAVVAWCWGPMVLAGMAVWEMIGR